MYSNVSQFIYDPLAEVPQGGRCKVCVGNASVGGASLVLGQPDFVTMTNPYTTQSGFRNPTMSLPTGTSWLYPTPTIIAC